MTEKITVSEPIVITRYEPPAREIKTFLKEEAEDTSDKKRATAILFAHGMGQQLPFENLNILSRKLSKKTGAQMSDIRLVKYGEDLIAPVELKMKDGKEVHLYESYWAYITEGKITGFDVIRFLFNACLNGIQNSSGSEFRRWVFKKFVSFPLKGINLKIYLMTAFVAILSAVTIFFAFLISAAGQAFELFGLSILKTSVIENLTYNTGAVFTASIALLIIAGLFLLLVKLLPNKARNVLLNILAGIVILFLTASMIFILSGLILPLNILLPGVVAFRNIFDYVLISAHTGPGWYLLFSLMFWSIFGWACFKARGFLIKYVGDVAAYVSSHKLNKFYQIRKDIKKQACVAANAIYNYAAGGKLFYDKIIIMGHSLGSVVSYDTLNTLINEDINDNERLKVVERTKLLLTFGSPLDKTAYIFRTQAKEDDEYREAIASAVQPLISDYRYRPAEWINIWSAPDWISSRLDYYDDGSGGSKQVNNIEDTVSFIPLKAHEEYWDHELLINELYKRI